MSSSAETRVAVLEFLTEHGGSLCTKDVSDAMGFSCGSSLDILSKAKSKPVKCKKVGTRKFWQATGKEYTPQQSTRKPAVPDFSDNTEDALNAIGRVLDENKGYREKLTELKLRCQGIVSDIEAMGL